MSKQKNPQCRERIVRYEGLARYEHQCTRQGKVERDGKWYCGQHDPEAVRARREAWDDAWSKQRVINQQQQAEDRAAKAIYLRLKALRADDPVGLFDALVKGVEPDHAPPTKGEEKP